MISQQNDKNFPFFPFKAELSFMTFEGQQIQGAPKILEKLQVCLDFLL